MKKTNEPSEHGVLHVKVPPAFVAGLTALREQAGVTREFAVNQALSDFFIAYVQANYPKVKLPKELQTLIKSA